MDQFFDVLDLGLPHYDIFPYETYYMQHISTALLFGLLLEATSTQLWKRVGIGIMVFWGSSIFKYACIQH